MKLSLQLVCLLPVLAGLLHADVPRKPLPSKYRDLWTDSPFTAKPVTTSGPVYNTLQDYVLLGVSPIDKGYRVTVINSKRPNDDRIIIESSRPVEGMKIEEVIHSEGQPMKTRVKISRGSSTAIIGFEDKFLRLKTASPVQPARPNNRVQPNANNGNQPPGTRQPRRRIIPPKPPVPGTQQGNSSNNQSNRRTR